MFEIRTTAVFDAWIDALRDQKAVERIARRILRFRAGLLGDVKPVGDGVMEMRVDHGPGYRVYYIRSGSQVIILLCGGDKRNQERDIAAAKRLANEERR